MSPTKITMRCSNCGSADVMRDAWAVWDDATQDWVLGNVFDAGFCDHCGEVRIAEVPLSGQASERALAVEQSSDQKEVHAQ